MSTSKLQRRVSELLSIHLGQYTIRENVRPQWLTTAEGTRLELDFYIEELNIAVEVQGKQHYFYTPHFHKDYVGFTEQLDRDAFKQKQCAWRGVKMFEIGGEQDALLMIDTILFYLPPLVMARINESEFYPRGGQAEEGIYINKILRITKYPRAIRKHLRQLYYTLRQFNDFASVTKKARRKIDTSLRAIKQHEKAKEPIQWKAAHEEVLRIARQVLET